MRAKKSLGQHFLRDENIARKIVESLDAEGAGNVLEVGPGTGILTRYLFERYPDTHVLEIDPEAWHYLRERFPGQGERIIRGDFLTSDLLERLKPPLSIIGNFPYNISSQIFFRVLQYRNRVKQVVCMIQKEVGDRIRSPHGPKTYGILSVLLQAWFDVEYLFPVGPKVFSPPPSVQSAVIRLKRNNRERLDCDEDLFCRVVKTAFNQRRKILRNSLKGHFTIPGPEQKIFSMRPEQLPVSGFIELTSTLESRKST